MSKYINFINGQFDRFKICILNTSKINIFSKSEEIYHKTIIRDCIVSNILSFNESELFVLYSMENFLDEVYEKICERNNKFTEKNIINFTHQVVKDKIKVVKDLKK